MFFINILSNLFGYLNVNIPFPKLLHNFCTINKKFLDSVKCNNCGKNFYVNMTFSSNVFLLI